MSDIDHLLRPDEPRRASRRRSPRRGSHRRHGERRGRSLLSLLVVLVVVALLCAGAWYGATRLVGLFATPDYAGGGQGSVDVQIREGDTAGDIAHTLLVNRVVKSEAAFVKAADADIRSRSLQPGTYRLRARMKGSLALALLLDPTARVLGRVTLPEGLTLSQALRRIHGATGIPLAGLVQAAGNPTALGLPAWAQGKPEGFLFPATYDVEPGTSATDLLRLIVAKFSATAAEIDLVHRASSVGRTPHDVVVVASILEKEGRIATDYPLIARVIYNRLARNVPLGVDAAVLYGLGRDGGALSAADLARRTPYNLRLVKGLPPTPIGNPGKQTLQAALAPAAGPYLYYVLKDRQGHNLFTADYNQFLAAKARCQAQKLC